MSDSIVCEPKACVSHNVPDTTTQIDAPQLLLPKVLKINQSAKLIHSNVSCKKILHMVVRFAAQNLQSNNQSRFITTRQQSYGKVMFSVMSVIPFSRLLYDHYPRVATCQEMSGGKNKIFSRSGKSQGILKK